MIKTHAKTVVIILFLLVISLWAMKALFHPGVFTSHDIWHQVARLYHFDQAIRDGQFPPRWSGKLFNGFGYPLFIFSYHLPWWIAEPFVLVGVSIFDAIKIVFLLTYVLSGLTMFGWLNSMWGRRAGFAGAFIYLFTPYRFANIFVRANIGEAVSFAFFPLIFWALYQLYQKKSVIWIVIGAIGIAGCLLSHVMVVFLFALPATFYYLYLMYVTKKRKTFFLSTLAMGCLGLSLIAYYLIPAIAYKPLTVFREMYHELYKNHFTPLSKLIYSPWGYGALGTAGEMSRQVGLVIWGIVGVSILNILQGILQRKSKKILLPVICILSFVFAIYMMLSSSLPVWKIEETLSLVDFPWRFLAITTFMGSILAGFFITQITSKRIQLPVLFLLMLAALYTNRNHLQVNQYTDVPLSLYIDSELTTNTDDEYLPKWVDRETAKKKVDLIRAENTNVKVVLQTSNRIKFSYETKEPTKATIHHMFFPDWVVYTKGYNQGQDHLQMPVKIDKGEMQIQLFPGMWTVELMYRPTMLMRIGEFITLLSFIIIISVTIKTIIWQRKL